MILTVEPAGYADALDGLEAGNRLAAALHQRLTGDLAGLGGMAGDDGTATDFAAAYDEAAVAALDAVADLVTAFTTLGRLTEQSLRNLARAEERSIMAGAVVSGECVEVPVGSWHSVLRSRPPTSLGGDAPALTPQEAWVLDQIEAFVWPDADVSRLRGASGIWRRTAGSVDALVDQCRQASLALASQRSPEVPLAVAAITDLGRSADDLAASCEALASHCDAYADAVEQQRAAIVSLVRQILLIVVEGMVIGALLGAVTAGAGTVVVSTAVVARVGLEMPRFASILATLRGLTTGIAGSVRLTRDAILLRRSRLERFVGVPLRTEAGQISLGSARFRPGWLARHEHSGGHTLSMHVGKTEDQLRRRLADSPHLTHTSSFGSVAQAERTLAAALQRHRQDIERWLRTTDHQLRLDIRTPSTTGITVSGDGSAKMVDGLRMILRRDPAMPEGFRVHTAFPQP